MSTHFNFCTSWKSPTFHHFFLPHTHRNISWSTLRFEQQKDLNPPSRQLQCTHTWAYVARASRLHNPSIISAKSRGFPAESLMIEIDKNKTEQYFVVRCVIQLEPINREFRKKSTRFSHPTKQLASLHSTAGQRRLRASQLGCFSADDCACMGSFVFVKKKTKITNHRKHHHAYGPQSSHIDATHNLNCARSSPKKQMSLVSEERRCDLNISWIHLLGVLKKDQPHNMNPD